MKENVYCTTYVPTQTGEIIIESEHVLDSSVEFNDQGKEIVIENFDENNSVFSKEVYEYDSNGNRISEDLYDFNNEIIEKIRYKYNEDGKVIFQSEQYVESEEQYITKYIYQDQKLVQIDHFCDEAFEYTEKKFMYEKNFLVKEIEYNEDEEVKIIIQYKYDINGMLVKMIKDEVIEKDRRSYEYFYDANGNKVKELIYNFKDKLIAAHYMKYNDKNQEIESEWEDLDNYRKTCSEYEGDLQVKLQILDKDGKVLIISEYIRDENGKILELRRYDFDDLYTNQIQLSKVYTYERID